MVFDRTKIQLTANDKAIAHWYDTKCKRVLSNKMVLAHLLKATMPEFARIEPGIIARRYIEGKTGEENDAKNIQGLRNERDSPNQNPSFFDIIFYVLLPGSQQIIPIFINVEAQTDYTPGYDLRNRAVFYAACMLADQKDSVFEKDYYDNLRKVCSIWICPEPPKSVANSIDSYSLKQRVIFGKSSNHPIDKIQIVLVHVGTAKDKNYKGIMPMLDICLAKKTDKEKQKQISKKFHLNLEPEDYDMTAGEQLVLKLKKEYWEAGERQGWEDGKKQGWEEEKQKIARSMKEKNLDYQLIAECTNLTQEQIEKL